MLSRLHHFLIPATHLQTQPPPRAQMQFWFWLSLTFAVTYAILGMRQSFGGEYVVQDDARQHVFWMRRFLDPELFPNDLIADYFQSTAPIGYAAIYQAAAAISIDPLWFNKVLPLALGLITTGYCFALCLQLLPVPLTGFVAALLLNQNLWIQDDLMSGIARAFVYPIFLAFLYYLLKKSLLPCLIAIALQGLIYPQLVFIMAAVLMLRLLRWDGRLRLSSKRQDYIFSGVGLAVAVAILLPYAIASSPYSPIVTVAAAKTMAEFQAQGRTRLFVSNFWQYWFTEERTGAFVWVMPLCILSIALLPLLLRFSDRFPLIQQVRHLSLLGQVAIASAVLFFAAHLLMFTLYLPSRYSQNTFQMLTSLTGAIAFTVVLDAVLRWANAPIQQGKRQVAGIVATIGLTLALLLSPYLWEFPLQTRIFAIGEYPAIYRFFADQPKDIMIASLAREADNLPTFTRRSILTSREYSVPYQLGYYQQMYRRTDDLIRAQYSPNPAEVQNFVKRYGVDFWMIDRAYLQRPYADAAGERRITLWLQQFQPTTAEAIAQADRGAVSVIRRRLNRCTVVKEKNLVVLSATCLTRRET
jgi:hypothetical protein